MEKKLRKYESGLICCGWGVLLLCIWTVIDAMINFYTVPQLVTAYVGEANTSDTVITVYKVAVAIILIISILLHLLVARSALLVGKGKKNKKGYLVLIVIFVLITFFNIFTCVNSLIVEPSGAQIVSLIFNLITLFILVETFVFSILVKSTRKKLNKLKSAENGE